MKKQFLSAALLAMTMGMQAQTFSAGTGTADDPYQIFTAEELQAVFEFPTASFIMMSDVDLDGVVWEPIQNFTGTFDGNGFCIDNLVIENGNNGVGLFNRMNAPGVIKNVTMRYADIVGGNWSGILCGTNGNWEAPGGDIINCYIYDSTIDGGENVGAFSGVAGGNYVDCHAFNVTVIGTNYTAGISGDQEANGMTGTAGYFKNCSFHGNVIGSARTGGICSFYNGTCKYDWAFENCVVYGNVSSSTGTVGGILSAPNWNCTTAHMTNCAVYADCSGQAVGSFGGDALRGRVEGCYATGKVTATGEWANGEWMDNWNGGICAVNFNGPILDCYFSGSISTKAENVKVAGICGRNWEGITVRNCYYNADGASVGMGDGDDPSLYDTHAILPEEMLSLNSFKFENMDRWQIVDGVTTPFFKNQTAPLTVNVCSTTELSGTCEADVEGIYVYGSISESILAECTIENGNWSVELNDGDVVESETLTIIGMAEDKMPSMAVKARVLGSNGIAQHSISMGEVQAVYSLSGQRLDGVQKGRVCIVRDNKGNARKVF